MIAGFCDNFLFEEEKKCKNKLETASKATEN